MNSNLFWCIIGIIGGAVFSLIINLIFYFVGLKRKHLTYNINTFSLISNNINTISGLDIQYNYHKINNLNISEIYFKNNGNCSLENHDFLPQDSIYIFTDGEFLSNDLNRITLNHLNEESKNINYCLTYSIIDNKYNKINFKFNYIPRKAHFKFSIFHTGNIELNGKLKEGKITQICNESWTSKMNNQILSLLYIFNAMFIIVASLFIYNINRLIACSIILISCIFYFCFVLYRKK